LIAQQANRPPNHRPGNPFSIAPSIEKVSYVSMTNLLPRAAATPASSGIIAAARQDALAGREILFWEFD